MPEQRSTLIKIIHVARRELGMDDDTYRAMLAGMPELAGVISTAQLAVPKLKLVLESLKQRGFRVRPKAKSKGKPHNFDTSMPESITKIEALLADMQLPWSYADGIAWQMFGIQRCAWVRDYKRLSSIIAALHVEQEKRSLKSIAIKLLMQLPDGERMVIEAQLPANWDRQRRVMRQLINHLEQAKAR